MILDAPQESRAMTVRVTKTASAQLIRIVEEIVDSQPTTRTKFHKDSRQLFINNLN